MKVKGSTVIKTVIFIAFLLNMTGIFFIYSGHFNTPNKTNILDFLPFAHNVYNPLRVPFFWISFVLLILSWFFWELFAVFHKKRIYSYISIVVVIFQLVFCLNLLSIIGGLSGVALKLYLTILNSYTENEERKNEVVL